MLALGKLMLLRWDVPGGDFLVVEQFEIVLIPQRLKPYAFIATYAGLKRLREKSDYQENPMPIFIRIEERIGIAWMRLS